MGGGDRGTGGLGVGMAFGAVAVWVGGGGGDLCDTSDHLAVVWGVDAVGVWVGVGRSGEWGGGGRGGDVSIGVGLFLATVFFTVDRGEWGVLWGRGVDGSAVGVGGEWEFRSRRGERRGCYRGHG